MTIGLLPINAANLTLALQNDAQWWRTTIDQVKTRYQAYAQNCTTENMTAAGISQGDQMIIDAFVGDLNRFKMLASGTLPSDADDMVYNVQAILGIL